MLNNHIKIQGSFIFEPENTYQLIIILPIFVDGTRIEHFNIIKANFRRGLVNGKSGTGDEHITKISN